MQIYSPLLLSFTRISCMVGMSALSYTLLGSLKEIIEETGIADILTPTHTTALVGASDKPNRPSYRVMKYLLDQGYYVTPVSSKIAGKTLLGQRGYDTLADVPEKVDTVDVFRSSEAAWGVAQEAIAIGTKTL